MTNSEQVVDEQPPELNNEGISLTWKIIIAVVAVVIIGLAALSFFRQEPPAVVERENSPIPVEPSTPLPTGSETQPRFATAEEYFQQGNNYVQSGQLQEAIGAYERAIELDPAFQAVYANLGVVYYQLEQLDLAGENYEKALALNPEDGEVTYNLGALTLQRALLSGNPPDPELMQQAIAQIEKSLELAPDLAEPYFSLGVAYLTLNQREQAIEAFENFLSKDTGSDPRASQEAQRYLDTLTAP